MFAVFALMALILVGGAASLATFLVALLFLPVRSALLFSPIFVGAGIFGGVLGLVVQIPLVDRPLNSGLAIAGYLGAAGLMGLGSAGLAAFALLRLRRTVLSKRETSPSRLARLFE